MKKIRNLCLILCLILLLQWTAFPALASETTDPTETASPTAPEDGTNYEEIPTVEYGSASVTNGCRTINGVTPLAGSERRLATSQAAFVYEVNTQTIIYSYNPDTRLYPGSLAKILTALIAIEQGDLEEVITFSTQWNSTLPVRSIVADLKEGEEVTLEALVYWLMLASANDAALNIAGHIAGSQAAFAELMNQKAAEIGCTDSHFTNAHGLDDPDQYTTARDMVKIILAATQNETFKEVFGAVGYNVPATNKTEKERVIESDNHLIYELILPQFNDDRVTGAKTSSTGGSGSSIICTAEDDGMSLVCVVMGAERTYNSYGNADYYGNFEEVKELLEYGFSDFKICRVLYPDMALNQFPVSNGECDVIAQPDFAVNSVLPADCTLRNLTFRYSVEGGGLYAPVERGAKIGTVQVWYHTSCVTESEIFAVNPVRSTVNSGVSITSAARDDTGLGSVLSFLGVAFLVLLGLFAVYLVINSARRAAARKRRRRRRASRRRSR